MSNIKLYDWIPFFAEVCCRLVKIGKLSADERDRKMEELSREVFGDDAMIVKPENLPANPFAFVYTLAKKSNNNERFYKHVKKVMRLNAAVPTDLIFPTPINIAFIPVGAIERLWKLFFCVYQACNAKHFDNEQFVEFFRMRNVGLKSSTQCMFLINPCCYLPLDTTSALEYLREPPFNEFEKHDAIQNNIANGQLRFHELLERVRKQFACLKPYEINLFAHLKVVNPTVKEANLKVDEDDDTPVAEIEPYRTELARIEKVRSGKCNWLAMICRRLHWCYLHRYSICKLFHKK